MNIGSISHHEEEKKDEEVAFLLENPIKRPIESRTTGALPAVSNGKSHNTAFTWILALALLALISMLGAHQIPIISLTTSMEASQEKLSPHIQDYVSVRYSCPPSTTTESSALNAEEEEEKQLYETSSHRIAQNLTEYLKVFRQIDFDDWGYSYNEIMSGLLPWKSRRFLDLRDNDTIYESASGVGMNLYMTLEILEKVKGVKNLVVYGNDYVASSVDIARLLAGQGHLPAGGKLGNFCPADSTNLSFVPSDAFDLVYTGYITPLQNPLQLNTSTTLHSQYKSLCEAKDGESMRLAQIAQKHQNDHYVRWVTEMIRIAKPGAPVIVEEVSSPLCEAFFDWGGVAQQFWSKAVDIYKWPIDPASLEIEKDRIFPKRYHVFMRKLT